MIAQLHNNALQRRNNDCDKSHILLNVQIHREREGEVCYLGFCKKAMDAFLTEHLRMFEPGLDSEVVRSGSDIANRFKQDQIMNIGLPCKQVGIRGVLFHFCEGA